jgi:hypothetical protein
MGEGGFGRLAGPASAGFTPIMLVIRRMVDRRRAYTAIFLPGEPARVFPTSDQEHARILQIFKQDRPYADILNDFTDYDLAAPRRGEG